MLSPPGKSLSIKVVLFIAAIVIPVYANTFDAAWHLDDLPNIVNNKALHLSTTTPQHLWNTFFASPLHPGNLYRPLACLSFALNYYFGGVNPPGYHLVNLGFHLATAFALFLLSVRILSFARIRGETTENSPDIFSIALLGTILWAIHPIQTQAVTYIVQRMAVMAAFFYLLAMLCFLKARTAETFREQCQYTVFCLFCFLCALGSKENAIMLPFTLMLMEWCFFRKGGSGFLRRPFTWILVCLVVIAATICVVKAGGGLIKGYDSRPFTLYQRLLTEPRVLLGYLTQILLPAPERFSITHDITVSTSIFHPWTTLPAVLVMTGLIFGALLAAPIYPVAAFSVLFFFLNHVVESSVLPLELVFEHRNYLPSLFLFLPIAASLLRLIAKSKKKSPVFHLILGLTIILMIVSLGLSTYMRNSAWATERSLWADAARKAPNSIRPLVTLGIEYGWKENPSPIDHDYAIALFRKALELPQTARKTERVEIMGNIAGVYSRRGDYDKAISTYLEALRIDTKFLKNRYDLIKALILKGRFAEAEHHARYLTARRPHDPQYSDILGFILLWRGQYNEALEYMRRAFEKNLQSLPLSLNIGIALTRMDCYENGRWFLLKSTQMNSRAPMPWFALIENRLRAGDSAGAADYAKEVVSRFAVSAIFEQIEKPGNDYRSAPLSMEMIKPMIIKNLDQYKSDLLMNFQSGIRK